MGIYFLSKFYYPLIISLICCLSSDKSLTYLVKLVHCGIVIDGKLDELVWKQTTPVTLKENESGKEVSDSSVTTQVKACYDIHNLYIAFVCNDPDIWCDYTRRDEYLWKEEVVEIFIDTDETPDNYIEIELSPSNVLFDSFIINPQKIDFAETSKFDLNHIMTAVYIDGTLNNREDQDKKWVVEMSIPFSDMMKKKNSKKLSMQKWRINFFRVNRDKGKEEGKYAWSPTYGSFHTPSKFGIFLFKKGTSKH